MHQMHLVNLTTVSIPHMEGARSFACSTRGVHVDYCSARALRQDLLVM